MSSSQPRSKQKDPFQYDGHFQETSGPVGARPGAVIDGSVRGGEKLKPGTWLAVRSDADGANRWWVPMVARSRDAKTPRGGPGLDRVVRVAMGLGRKPVPDEWGKATIREVASGQPGVGDAFLRKTLPGIEVLARVVTAELTLAEQNCVVLEELTLDAMGLTSGSDVILHSVAESDGQLTHYSRRVKAYAENDKMRRARKYNPDNEKSDHPELPRVWIGEALRSCLHLDPSEQAEQPPVTAKVEGLPANPTVIVEPSRGYLISEQFREFALLLALTSLGFVSLFDFGESSPPLGDQFVQRWPVLLALVALVFIVPSVLIYVRLKEKLR